MTDSYEEIVVTLNLRARELEVENETLKRKIAELENEVEEAWQRER